MTRTPYTLADLLADCDAHGIRLAVTDGDGLDIDAPQGSLTPALLDRLRSHKGELLAVLTPPIGWPRDLPLPAWWSDLSVVFGDALRSARQQHCMSHDGYPGCGFPVAVQWCDENGERHWSCPACGLSSVGL